MKVMTILGTRPEIIRLSLVIEQLDQFCDHTLVHTGQNYDARLSGLFFDELKVRAPDVNMGVRSPTFAGQIGQILERSEALLLEHHPDRLLVLGDTNSGMTSIIARRLGIPVYHMEAGNRCFDDRVPEEVNRRVIDHSSSILMPYTNRSRENLIAEGIAPNKIYVTGNPIGEVIKRHDTQISDSHILTSLSLNDKQYFLVTMHRAENVDVEARIRSLVGSLILLSKTYGLPVICSLHPRTRSKFEEHGLTLNPSGVRFVEPLGFIDFVHLERSAFCILTDSGTVQEEACILGVPSVTIRDVTERPETIECGSTILSGVEPSVVLAAVEIAVSLGPPWEPPAEYTAIGVARTVSRLVMGYRIPDLAEIGWQAR